MTGTREPFEPASSASPQRMAKIMRVPRRSPPRPNFWQLLAASLLGSLISGVIIGVVAYLVFKHQVDVVVGRWRNF